MTTLNWFDIAVVLILVWSAITGLRAGLARVVVGFIATIVGLMAGFWCYRLMAVKLLKWVRTPTAANILGFLIIFVGALILGALISSLLSRFFNWMGLSWFNHVLGGVAGFFRGAVMIAALVDILVAFSPSPMPDFLAESRVLPYASEVASLLVSVAPRPLKDAFDQQMDNLKRLWSQPTERASAHHF
jgi:membrane protein required for colicin V production